MSFKENLSKKIEIDKLARRVMKTIGSSGSEVKVDKKAMQSLLSMGPYEYLKERDMELFIELPAASPPMILVLDNELPFYRTTVADVALRKSPTVKEMVSIRNAIKILNDKDVVVSKRADSLKTVRQKTIEGLDLSFTPQDLAQLAEDGAACLEAGDVAGVQAHIDLFSELLDLKPVPKDFRVKGYKVIGLPEKSLGSDIRFGMIILYGAFNNELKLVNECVSSNDKEQLEMLQQVAIGKETAPYEGGAVFQYLREKAKGAGYDPLKWE